MLPKPLAVGILTLVTLVWSVDFGAQFVTDHQPSPAIQGTFLALVGGALIRAGWVARRQADAPQTPERTQPGEPANQPTPPSPSPSLPPRSSYRTWNGDDGRHRRPRLSLRGAWA